jgi:hypothetical protein
MYTILYGIFFGFASPLLPSLINQTADRFALGFFNIMGLFPLLFLVDGLEHYSVKTWKVLFLLLGFLTGAYGIALFFLLSKPLKERTFKPFFDGLVGFTLALLIAAVVLLFQGNPSLFFMQWTEDAMVGIMSVDFLALYALSLYQIYQVHHVKKWGYAIPLFGYAWYLIKRP